MSPPMPPFLLHTGLTIRFAVDHSLVVAPRPLTVTLGIRTGHWATRPLLRDGRIDAVLARMATHTLSGEVA